MAFSQNWASDFDVVGGTIRAPGSVELRRDTSGVPHIDKYDGIVIIGMGAQAPIQAAAIYQTHRLLIHRQQGKHLLSADAFEVAMTEGVLRAGVWHILARIRHATEMPVLIVPDPLMNSAIAEDEEWSGALAGEHAAFLVEQYFQACAVDARLQGRNHGTAQETIEGGAFTQSTYGHGGLRDAVNTTKGGRQKRYKEEDRDYRHMNEQYGKLVCRDIGGWLDSRGL